MDNFMDKIAQKLNAQEIIRANSAADAAQIEKLQEQVSEYDICMKEMRKLNLKNAENEQKLQELIETGSSDLKNLTEECLAKIEALETGGEGSPDIHTELQQLKAVLDGQIEKTQELLKQSDEFSHKESVKVYRNVQAVIVEELEKQTQALMSFGQETTRREKKMVTVGIITMVAVAVNILLLVIHAVGIF